MEEKRCGEEWKPVWAMLAVDITYGVINTLVKKSLDDGLNCLVLITLRQLTATAFLAPIALFHERKSRPNLSGWILFYIFISAMLGGSIAQYLFFIGLQYTSATFACAFLNVTPVLTFIVALPLRMDTLNLRSISGKAKLIAIMTCLGGTMILMLYKGIPLTYQAKAYQATTESTGSQHYKVLKWTLGTVMLFSSCLLLSAWFLVQTKISKMYPVVYSSTAIMFFFSFLQSAVLTLATQPGELSIWMLKGRVEVVTVLLAGLVGSGMGTLTMSWCVMKRGPVFTAAFSPLIQIVVAIIDFSFLREPLYVGSVLGSLLVVLGLYALLWGKNKDAQEYMTEHPKSNDTSIAGNDNNPNTEDEPV